MTGLSVSMVAFMPARLGAVDGADDGMDVRVDETGQDELAAKIDDVGRRPDQLLHVSIIANGEDGVAGKGDRLLDGAVGIGRVDLAVVQHDVGLALLSSACVGGP